jgi:hypothetical protein
MQVGVDIITSTILQIQASDQAGELLTSFVPNFIYIYSISSGYGQTIKNYQPAQSPAR